MSFEILNCLQFLHCLVRQCKQLTSNLECHIQDSFWHKLHSSTFGKIILVNSLNSFFNSTDLNNSVVDKFNLTFDLKKKIFQQVQLLKCHLYIAHPMFERAHLL